MLDDVYNCNNLDMLRSMSSESIDLVATDPPYCTGRNFGDFDDVWKSMSTYLDFMRLRLLELRRLLKPSGTLYLQCDTNASHHLKLMLDDIFGKSNFRNQIIWQRTTACKNNVSRNLPDNTDIILMYSKSKKFVFNVSAITLPYDINNLDDKTKRQYCYVDDTGRLYALCSLISPQKNTKPEYNYELMGITRTWRWAKDRMYKAVDNGRVIQRASGNVPRYKRYLDEQKGKVLNNIWTDINNVNARHKESVEYATQKPIALYKRIISLSSNENAVVLDPFCGSGTTLIAAKLLNRRYVGIDVNNKAIRVSKKRLSEIGDGCLF